MDNSNSVDDVKIPPKIKEAIVKTLLVFVICSTFFLSGCADLSKAKQPDPHGYVKIHPQLSEKFKQAILNRQLIIGMSKDDVIAVMGEPFEFDKHITTTRWNRSEQWVYNNGGTPTYYIYFDNDKLSAVQKY